MWSSRRVSSPRGALRAALALSVFTGLLLGACEQRPPEVPPPVRNLAPVGFEALPGWREDAVSEALPALLRSCDHLAPVPDERPLGPDGLGGTVADWREPCAALRALPKDDDEALRAALAAHFIALAVRRGTEDRGLFTGYYEAELKGAMSPDERHRWPLYAVPPDLVVADLGRFRADLKGMKIVGKVEDGELVPYPERAEIESGMLAGKNLEVAWVDDPVDAFILHVQGSGRVILPDGEVLRVGFAATNGLPFTGVGRILLDNGHVPPNQASMQDIRAWLRAHPEEAREIMHQNARFVFFRVIEGEGPIGAFGVPLTPGRSLAVDPAFMPLGAPVWLDTTWPGSDRPLRRLMVAQDTGGAIKGAVRGDVFWGYGEPALEQAGRMKEKGRYYLLLPKPVAAAYLAGS